MKQLIKEILIVFLTGAGFGINIAMFIIAITQILVKCHKWKNLVSKPIKK